MSAEWLGQFHADLSPVEKANRADRQQEREEAREEERARAERQDRREAMLFANMVNGDPLGEMAACQRRMSDLQDRVDDLRGQLEEAEAKLASVRSQLEFHADQHLVTEELVSRSAPLTDPVYAALERGREELRRAEERRVDGRAEVNRHRQRLAERLGQR